MDDELSLRLAPLRAQIDALDVQLLTLLSQRAALTLEIGELKKDLQAPVFQGKRERQVVTQLQTLNRGPLQSEHIAAIWREIMAASRALEKQLTIAFLGPAGTFSEQAMFAYFGHTVHGLSCASIDEVFRAVEANAADLGIAPIENSTQGSVSRTLDLLLQSPLAISGEVTLPICHHLLTRAHDLASLMRVCAHAQALAQCQQWLATHLPHVTREAVSSTAQAAQMAAGDPSIAAIASERAAAHYDLRIACRMIQDDPHNRTRFIVIGGSLPEPTGKDRTSLVLSVKNQPGAVFQMLEPLARHRVSMTRFESRPAKNGVWEYAFYIDLAGHRMDAPVAAALAELEPSTAFIKVLGSYPQARSQFSDRL